MTKNGMTRGALALLLASTAPTHAQAPADIGTVNETGRGPAPGSAAPEVPQTAAQFAPSRPNID